MNQYPPRTLAFSESGRDQAVSLARAKFGHNFKAGLGKSAYIELDSDKKFLSKDTIRRAFELDNVGFDSLNAICKELNLNWEEVSNPNSYNYGASAPGLKRTNSFPIDELVVQVREAVSDRIHHDCSQLNPLHGQGQIDARYVEPDLFQLQRLPSEQPIAYEKLIGRADEENYDRLGIRMQYGESSLTGNQAVIQHIRLLIYGSPGSGKTSYLKWIAMQCIQGHILANYVPVFLSIKDFVAVGASRSLNTYIEQYLEYSNIDSFADKTRTLMLSGRLVLLLDGFDEVSEPNLPRIIQDVNDILTRYQKCRFIFSCRLPLSLTFPLFQRVLIPPFIAKKIQLYVNKWFSQPGEDPGLANQFLERLRHYPALSELTRTPFLLELLCIVFKTNQKFPSTRAGVYEQGIEELLRARDQSFRSRSFNGKITREHIRGVLRKVAADFFMSPSPQILFYKRDVERKIEDYFTARFGDSAIIPTVEILKNLELHNGLLVSRAYDYYSFSHLTFQEYFTADHLVKTGSYRFVYPHITAQEWRFVIALVSELLSKEEAEDFFENFKQTLDDLVSSNDKIRRFLTWINRMAASISASLHIQRSHKQTLLRAWYFVFTFEDVGIISSTGNVSQQFSFPDYELATSTITGEVLDAHALFYRAYHATKTDNYSNFTNVVDEIYNKFSDDSPWLENQLNSWKKIIQLQQTHHRHASDWWLVERGYWQNRVSRFMERQHNLRCDWGFTNDEQTLLRKYYNATKLFSLCLNRSKISLEKRHILVDRMLYLNMEDSELNGDDFIGF